jgi:hypothetical protein
MDFQPVGQYVSKFCIQSLPIGTRSARQILR